MNLSALRFDLFPNANGPACIVTLVPRPPDGQPLAYWSPKRHYTEGQGRRIVIDGSDLNWIDTAEAAGDPWSWTALAWGGRRDHELIRRINGDRRRTTLKKIIADTEGWSSKKGFERRIKDVQHDENRLGLRILEKHQYWGKCGTVCSPGDFPRNTNPVFGRPRELEAFRLPLLIMHLSWTVEHGRFKASLCEDLNDENYLLFSQSYYGISAPKADELTGPALVLNSVFAVYFLFLTSSRLGSYLPTSLIEDIKTNPSPNPSGSIGARIG